MSDTFDARFSRNFEAISKEEQAQLAEKHVAVLGCGGLGGYVVEYLARLGVGFFTLCDGDVFDQSNLNRQLLSTEDSIGQNKAEAAKARILDIHKTASVAVFPENMTDQNAGLILSGCDVAVCALDTVSARRVLAEAAKTLHIPVVFGAIAGWCGQVAVMQPGDNLLDMLYPAGEERGEEMILGNLSFTAALCAALQAAETAKALLARPVGLIRGQLLQFDLLQNTFEEIIL